MYNVNVLLLLLLLAAIAAAQHFVNLAAQCGKWSCPVDCAQAVDAAGCSSCQCPTGARCPQVVCQGRRGVRCSQLLQMDGCATCICDGPVYALLDSFNNVHTFFADRAVRGSRETCRMEDLPQLERCTRGIMEYEHELRQIKPHIAHPVIPWFFYSTNQLAEICKAVVLLPSCVGRERLERCRQQHPRLSYLHHMFNYPCVENRDEFNDQFSCVSNVIASHSRVASCLDTMERELYVSRVQSGSLFNKQTRKCGAINHFIECARDVMELHCSKVAGMVFHETIIKGVMYIAPECIINAQGLMQPRPIAVTTAVISQGPSRNLLNLALSTDEAVQSQQRQHSLIDLDAMPDIENQISVTPASLPSRCGRFRRARSRCRDGGQAVRVLRWFRPTPTSVRCESYEHNFCRLDEPDDEQVGPIRYEDECMDLCFGHEESRRLFGALQFVDRIRATTTAA